MTRQCEDTSIQKWFTIADYEDDGDGNCCKSSLHTKLYNDKNRNDLKIGSIETCPSYATYDIACESSKEHLVSFNNKVRLNVIYIWMGRKLLSGRIKKMKFVWWCDHACRTTHCMHEIRSQIQKYAVRSTQPIDVCAREDSPLKAH